MSECERRFGDWGLLNPIRDGFCTLIGISTVAPAPTPPPYVPPAPSPFRPTPLAAPEITARQVVTITSPEAPSAQPQIIVKAPPTVEITADDWRKFQRLGDVNLDGVIDSKDVDEVKGCYGQRVGSELWSVCARCDLNGDGKVDVLDLVMCQFNRGLTVYKWKETQA